MRLFGLFSTSASVLLFAAGCGDSGGGAGPGPDAGSTGGGPDATVTSSGPDASTGTGDLAVPDQGFQLRSADVQLAPGEEQTYCWYFTIPGDAAQGVKRWQSKMTEGSHHLIVYFTDQADMPDGTLVTDCQAGNLNVSNIPIWTYSAQTPDYDAQMPDGVGMAIKPQQHGYIQMHYLNATDEDLTAHVTVNGFTFAPGESFIQAAAYITFNTQISIPAGVGSTGSAEGTCQVPADVNFFALSTHSHRRSVDTWVKDGSSMLLMSDDWAHPPVIKWSSPSFYHFTTSLTYHCDYVNDLDQAVYTGNSAQTNEMCMAVGYFFPATSPIFCLNSQVFGL